ncbi:MAG: SH3 domain-containing C40 family peptidase [Lachnospiraceae bacterium]|nr:SH3 domain-containing C40 family peptidase [Lachnospiraceae bacterium]MDY4969062.1 SH3 domain-containing C40 family peptidase [Lachnospiraceae bacterium]
MITQRQNILHTFLGAAILILLFGLGSIHVSAASITRDTDSSFEDVAIAQVNSYVNVRSKASTSGKVVGKMYDNTAAVIKKTVNGEDGTWYYISSGSVTGYVKAAYFATGSSAAKIAADVGSPAAKVTASGLRLRKSATTASATLTVLPQGTTMSVAKKNVSGKDGLTFSKITVTQNGSTKTGYVAQDYIDFCVSLKTATAVNTGSSSNSSSGSSSSSGSTSSTGSSSASAGASIAATAQKYVGKLPYVWGGTSLKSGADCSGFTQSIYKLYGVSIPRTSTSQAAGGRSISRSQLQVGDLVFYKNGGSSICHVAIYIGNGKIVHEANSRDDCKISNIDYDTPVKYVTYLR